MSCEPTVLDLSGALLDEAFIDHGRFGRRGRIFFSAGLMDHLEEILKRRPWSRHYHGRLFGIQVDHGRRLESGWISGH